MATLMVQYTNGGTKTVNTKELSAADRKAIRVALDRNDRVRLYEVSPRTPREYNTWGPGQAWKR
jgi:hypothetical protein